MYIRRPRGYETDDKLAFFQHVSGDRQNEYDPYTGIIWTPKKGSMQDPDTGQEREAWFYYFIDHKRRQLKRWTWADNGAIFLTATPDAITTIN